MFLDDVTEAMDTTEALKKMEEGHGELAEEGILAALGTPPGVGITAETPGAPTRKGADGAATDVSTTGGDTSITPAGASGE